MLNNKKRKNKNVIVDTCVLYISNATQTQTVQVVL